MRHHLEYHIQFWVPEQKTDMDQLKQVQRKTMKMIRRLEYLSFEGRLRQLGLFKKDCIIFDCWGCSDIEHYFVART